MISKRLKALGDMVSQAPRVIDVGCDHALLDIYLASKLENTEFLVTDISSNAIKNAIKNIKSNNLESRITTLVTDGLNDINLNKDDFIIISGVGTSTIIKIISAKLDNIENLLVQSNRDLETLRMFLFENGFGIRNEKVIYDKNYYVFIHFVKRKQKYSNEDIWLGPIIKKSGNKDYLQFMLKKYKKILSGIPDNDLKKFDIINRIKILTELTEKM